jgi:hypothetical protein
MILVAPPVAPGFLTSRSTSCNPASSQFAEPEMGSFHFLHLIGASPRSVKDVPFPSERRGDGLAPKANRLESCRGKASHETQARLRKIQNSNMLLKSKS